MSNTQFPPPAPPIPMRSDEQFVRELAERMRRVETPVCTCGRAAVVDRERCLVCVADEMTGWGT